MATNLGIEFYNTGLKELTGDGNGRVKWTRSGATCHREFIGTPAAFNADPYLIGMQHPLYDYLLVESVELVPEGLPIKEAAEDYGKAELYRVLVDYSYTYQRPVLGDPPKFYYESVSEALMTGAGRVWDDCGEVIEAEDLQTATMYTQIRITVDQVLEDLPVTTLQALVNHVNLAEWKGFAAGTVLFEEFSEQAEWDQTNGVWCFRVQYRFLVRDRSHNEIWRGPIPKRDVTGQIMYYQNTDVGETDTYNASAYLAGHPIPKAPHDGKTPGAYAWTTTTPKLYESADFAALHIGEV